MRIGMLTMLLVAASCGGSTPDGSGEPTASTVADLCAGGYVHSADGVATTVGCSFENQLNNVYNYGKVSAPVTLFDANGQQLASATRTCDTWWQAKDAEGVTVLLNEATGEVRAHGMVHPSMPTTTLPQYVPLPIAAH